MKKNNQKLQVISLKLISLNSAESLPNNSFVKKQKQKNKPKCHII